MRIPFGVALASLSASASLPAQSPIDTALAGRYFREASALIARDGGSLWGRSLAGPMLFADRATHAVLADRADSAGQLTPLGGFFAGTLPASENVSNTGITWAGVRWMMVAWPTARDSLARAVLLPHELFHRIQRDLGFPDASPGNTHLGTRDGRLWMRMEARALRRALEDDGALRLRALRDAIAFRRARRALFRGADSTERALEINEGLAEYTGVAVGLATAAERAEWVRNALVRMDTASHFERSFAYQTGPAYGLLLDALAPEWRQGLTPREDLADRLERAVVKGTRGGTAAARGAGYGYAAVRKDEAARAVRLATRTKALNQRFVTGPLLVLPLVEMRMGFDPSQVEALASTGSVYGSLRLTDAWGILQCDASGGLITPDYQHAVVPAPADTSGRRLTGPGWVLELAPGWRLAHGRRPGDWTLSREP